MKAFFEDCLNLPYRSNSQDNPYHEDQVEALLIKHGLSYKSQPNGIQNSPDFMVYYNGNEYPIECKSSKGAYPMYNGGLPKKGVIYVFSSKKYDATTVFRAEDVVSDSKRQLYSEMLTQLNDVLETFRSKPEWQEDDRGFDFYIRSMYIQSGGSKYADYFKHESRSLCESNVLLGNY